MALPIADSPSSFAGFFSLPDFNQITRPEIWKVALVLAVVASLESMLCIEAADKLDPFHRISNTNKELRAQVVGNLTSGLLGGLPVTSVIVRSSANIYSGARTRGAAFFHGILLLVCVVSIPGILNKIPLASLAAILLTIGYKLANIPFFRKMYESGKVQFIPFMSTVLIMVFTDLLTGVFAGMMIGFFYVLRTNHHNSVTVVNVDDYYLIRFNKDMTFVNKNELKKELRNLPDNIKLIIDGGKADLIDGDILEILDDFKQSAVHRNIALEIKGVNGKTSIKMTGV